MSGTVISPTSEAAYVLGGDQLDIQVREIMSPGVVTVPEDVALRHVFRAMARHRVHAVLIVGRGSGRPLGWVTARGLLAWVKLDTALAPACSAVTERPVTIDPSATAREAIGKLSVAGTTHLLVSRGDDVAAEGVLTELDVVSLVAG